MPRRARPGRYWLREAEGFVLCHLVKDGCRAVLDSGRMLAVRQSREQTTDGAGFL